MVVLLAALLPVFHSVLQADDIPARSADRFSRARKTSPVFGDKKQKKKEEEEEERKTTDKACRV